jgi:hypothetical protein
LDIHPLAASEHGRYLADWAAVQQADALVSEVIEQITQTFTNEHSSLKNQWNQGNDISTEDSARICSATAPSSTVWGLKIDEVLNKDRLKIQHCKVTLTRISRDQVILGA